MPPDPAGGIFFCLTPAVGQLRVTTIVVVVNIYTYKYYYFSGHFQVPLGFTCIARLFNSRRVAGLRRPFLLAKGSRT